jgi:hypothetical protein
LPAFVRHELGRFEVGASHAQAARRFCRPSS